MGKNDFLTPKAVSWPLNMTCVLQSDDCIAMN